MRPSESAANCYFRTPGYLESSAKARAAWNRAYGPRTGALLLECPTIHPLEFAEGYERGLASVLDGEDWGTKSTGKVPTPWSRGFACGAKAATTGGWDLPYGIEALHRPYNETVKYLRERYPFEYPETDQEKYQKEDTDAA